MRDQAWIEKRAADLAGTPGQCPPANSRAMLQAKREAEEHNARVRHTAAAHSKRVADAKADQHAANNEGGDLAALMNDAVSPSPTLPGRAGSSELKAETSVADKLQAMVDRRRPSTGRSGPQYGD